MLVERHGRPEHLGQSRLPHLLIGFGLCITARLVGTLCASCKELWLPCCQGDHPQRNLRTLTAPSRCLTDSKKRPTIVNVLVSQVWRGIVTRSPRNFGTYQRDQPPEGTSMPNPQVLISYARKDGEDSALQLQEAVRQHVPGIEVWHDHVKKWTAVKIGAHKSRTPFRRRNGWL